jgi:hypothetical protein
MKTKYRMRTRFLLAGMAGGAACVVIAACSDPAKQTGTTAAWNQSAPGAVPSIYDAVVEGYTRLLANVVPGSVDFSFAVSPEYHVTNPDHLALLKDAALAHTELPAYRLVKGVGGAFDHLESVNVARVDPVEGQAPAVDADFWLVHVSGRIEGRNVGYTGTIMRTRYQDTCEINVWDPVLPDVPLAYAKLLNQAIPNCQSPRESLHDSLLLRAASIENLEPIRASTIRAAAESLLAENPGEDIDLNAATAGDDASADAARVDAADAADARIPHCAQTTIDGSINLPANWNTIASCHCGFLWLSTCYTYWYTAGSATATTTCGMNSKNKCVVLNAVSQNNTLSDIQQTKCNSTGFGAGGTGNAVIQMLSDGTDNVGTHLGTATTLYAVTTNSGNSNSGLQVDGTCAGDYGVAAHGTAGVHYTANSSATYTGGNIGTRTVNNLIEQDCVTQ